MQRILVSFILSVFYGTIAQAEYSLQCVPWAYPREPLPSSIVDCDQKELPIHKRLACEKPGPPSYFGLKYMAQQMFYDKVPQSQVYMDEWDQRLSGCFDETCVRNQWREQQKQLSTFFSEDGMSEEQVKIWFPKTQNEFEQMYCNVLKARNKLPDEKTLIRYDKYEKAVKLIKQNKENLGIAILNELVAEPALPEAQYSLAQLYIDGKVLAEIRFAGADNNLSDREIARDLLHNAAKSGHEPSAALLGEIVLDNFFYKNQVDKMRSLEDRLITECSQNSRCAFETIWDFLDVSSDNNISLAELSKFQRSLVTLAYLENESNVEREVMLGIQSMSILLLPITAKAILNSYDYNNDGVLQKEEVLGDTDFAELIGISTQSVSSNLDFKSLGQRLSSQVLNSPMLNLLK